MTCSWQLFPLQSTVFEILPRTGKWIHRHRMILTIHDPIPPKGKGMENIKLLWQRLMLLLSGTS